MTRVPDWKKKVAARLREIAGRMGGGARANEADELRAVALELERVELLEAYARHAFAGDESADACIACGLALADTVHTVGDDRVTS